MLSHRCYKCLMKMRAATGSLFSGEVYPHKQLRNLWGLSDGQTQIVAKTLLDGGYLRYAGSDGDSKIGYVLAEKGIYYRELNAKTVFLFILTHIFLPICISIATTLITLWVNGLLPT